MIIKGSAPEIQIKQKVYFPGLHLSSYCKCGKQVDIDLGKVYLSYFQVNKETNFYFICPCGHTWSELGIIKLSISSYL
jgi:hypothetical protein